MTDAKSNAYETDILQLVFNNTALAKIGDASGLQPSAVAGSLHVSLHTSDPGEAGDQTTNEISYTGYGRVAVARSTAGWTVSGDTSSNAAAVTFGKRTNTGSATATHFGVGTDSTGAGLLLYFGALDSNLAISQNVTPEFAAGDLDIQET